MKKLNESRLKSETYSIIRPLFVIGALLLFYFFLVGRTKLLNDADTLWHIAVGRTILDSGLITQDHYSFTRGGEPWIANQWLAECVLAVADRVGGFDGVLVLTVAILTATYLALGYRWLARGFDPLLTLAFITLILSASAYTFNARPHIVSIGLLGLVFAMARDVEDGRARLPQLAWLVPLFILWSNLHGGVLGGLGTVVLIATGWTLQWLIGMTTPVSSSRDALVLWLCVAGCGLALIVTPYGVESLRAWLAIMSMSLPDLIIEHAPLRLGTPEGMLAILLFIVYITVFASTSKVWSRVTFWLPLVWFALACSRIRHAPLFAIVAGIALADLLPQSRWGAWLARRGWLRAASLRNDGRFKFGALRVVAAGMALLVPIFGATIWLKHVGPLPIVGRGWARPAPRIWPEDLLSPLAEYVETQSDGTRIFNEPILGGYLIYNFPKLRVFIDGRCELYGESFLREFVAAWQNPGQVDLWQKEFGFRAALIEASSPLRSYFDNSNEWQQVAKGTSAVLYRMDKPGVEAAPEK